MRRVILALGVTIAVVPAARADWPVTQSACADVSATVEVWKQFGNDVLENLGFDGLGNVWVSNSTKGQIERYGSNGISTAPSIALAGPGAITLGPDGLLYANYGDALAGALLRTAAAGVVRFQPADPSGTLQTFATGINMANGGIFDAAGNLYVSNDVDAALMRIPTSGPAAGLATQFSDTWGTNGLVVAGGSLYAAITFDQRSAIEEIPLAAPSTHSTFTELSFGALSLQPDVRVPQSDPVTTPLVGLKGLDDMTLGPDGRLYVVANGMGELLRVDLATKQACLVASGLQNPSSVRFASSFGDDTGDIFITEFSGAVRHVELSPAS